MSRSLNHRRIQAAVLATASAAVSLAPAARAADVVTIVPGTLTQGTVKTTLVGDGYADESDNLAAWLLNTGPYNGGLAAISFENPLYNNPTNPNSVIAFGNGGGVTLQLATPITPVAGEKDLGVFTAQAITGGTGTLFNGNMEAAILLSTDGVSWYTLAGTLVPNPTTYTANASLLNAPTMAYNFGTCATAWAYGHGTAAANLNALPIASYTTPMPDDRLFNSNGSNAQRLALATDASAADYTEMFGNSGGGNWFDISGSGLSQVDYIRLNGDANDPNTGGVRLEGVFASANSSLDFGGSGNYTDGNALSGNTAMTIACTGTVTLSGNNTAYTGTANVSNGTLNLANLSALVSGGLNVAGGNVTFDQNAGDTSFTIANLSGGGGNVILQTNAASNPAAVALSVGGDNSSTTYGGLVSGIGSLIKVGNGTLTLINANTYSGGTTINAGTLNVTTAINGLLAGSNVANYAALQFAGSQTLGTIGGNGTTTVTGSLTVTSFVQASLINNGTTTITGNSTIGQLSGTGSLNIGNGALANTITLATTATPGVLGGFTHSQGSIAIASGSTLDITNNALLLNYGSGSSPLAAVANAVTFGAGSGGNGSNGSIISTTVNNSSAAGKCAVGYADHTEISTVPTGNVEVAYTLAGDANLDGSVDILDYQQMAPHYDEAGTYDWSQGDFNHDGHVDILDYQAMAPNYDSKLTAGRLTGASLSQAIGGLPVSAMAKPIGSAVAAEAMTAVEATDIATVPEPAGVSLLLLGGLPMLCRRRKRS